MVETTSAHEEISSVFDEAPSLLDEPIGIDLFRHPDRKSTRLVSNDSPNDYISGRKSWLGFDLQEAIYVTEIVVHTSGYSSYDKLEYSYSDCLSGQDISAETKYSENLFRIRPNAMITGFGIRPDSKLFRETFIERIEVSGVPISRFSKLISLYRDSESVKKNLISEAQEKINQADLADLKKADLTNAITELQRQKSAAEDQKSETEKLVNAQLNRKQELDIELKSVEGQQRSLQGKLIEIEETIEKRIEERRKANADVVDLESELKDLKGQIDLFPSDLSGYIAQGAKATRIYAWVTVIPLLVIAFITWRLLMNADTLVFDFNNNPNINISAYLLSRAPYVIISGTVLLICYTISARLISEVVNINRRRQEIFKINIIATDVSMASEKDLGLDDVEIYNLRTYTKMEMLKEHLREHMSESFEYTSRDGLLDKMAKRFSPSLINPEQGTKIQSTVTKTETHEETTEIPPVTSKEG